MTITPFDKASDVTRIGVRLAPLDVGFDLREDDMIVAIPADTRVASYADRDGDRWVVDGTCDEIVRVLRSAGYRIQIKN